VEGSLPPHTSLPFPPIQSVEDLSSPLKGGDGPLATTLHLATGFHGFHVALALLPLTVATSRFSRAHLVRNHHLGFEGALLYWHFVDVVWLFLLISILWW
jgi:heme/copper-type cytochrome/quinol oxidase subunit 3